jgi:hypothetical protein
MTRSMAFIRLAMALLLFAAVFELQVPAAQSAVCTEGQTSSRQVGPTCSCPGGRDTPMRRYQCIGGVWVAQEDYCGGTLCQPSYPEPCLCFYEPGNYCPPPPVCNCCI